MSLLITSSQSKENTNAIGIEKPESYTNQLRSSLVVPPYSQIAVDSVKINRNPQIDYSDGRVCNFWFGERIDKDLANDSAENGIAYANTTSFPIVQENLIRSSVGVGDFQDGFRRMLREAYCYHPEMNTSNTQNASIMEARHLAGTLQGFKFNMIQALGNNPTPLNTVPNASTAQKEIFAGQGAGFPPTYDALTGSLTAGSNDQLILYATEGATEGPVSLNDGNCTFNVSDTRSEAAPSSREYCVGLTRSFDYADGAYTNSFNNVIGMSGQGGLGQDNDVFFDYAVEAKDGVVKLYHFLRDKPAQGGVSDGDDNEGTMTEIIYYNKTNDALRANNGSNSDFAAGNAPCNASEVQSVTFNFKNEILKVTVSGDTFNASVLVNVVKSNSASFQGQIPKPVNQACWKMYPMIWFAEELDVVNVTEFDQRTGVSMDTNIFYGPSDWQARCNGDYYPTLGFDPDTDDRHNVETLSWVGSRWWPTQVEQRPWGLQDPSGYYDYSAGEHFPKLNYKSIIGLGSTIMDDYENIFIVGSDKTYLQQMPQQLWQPNVARQLGMTPYSIYPPIPSITAGLGSKFQSERAPDLSSMSSAFIRVPRLPHTSYNAGAGSISKIIAMIPRFDNAGNDSGALYFEKNEKLYVDLNNTDPLTLTDISVDIVRRDETFVNDLTGSTEVVFHIRAAPKM